jgi:acetylglutamate kinase
VRLDHRADAVVGQDFEQQRVLDAAVDDVHALDAVARGVERRADLRQHPAGQRAILDHLVDLLGRDAGDQLAVLVEHARRVGQQHQLFGLEDLGDLAGDDVGIDVVGFAILADADRRDDRDEGAGIEQADQRRVDLCNLADLIDVGQVGEITQIDPSLIGLLDSGAFIPVIAPIGVGKDGETYNINADVVAGKIAEVLKAEKLVLLTNTPGVLDKNGELITGITPKQIDEMVEDGTLSGGMLPKIGSALDAARNGVKRVHIIDGRVEHALLLEILTDHGVGTMIKSH